MYNEGPKGTPYVRNVKEKEVNRHNFSNMSDQDLADELKEAEAILQAISDELINREFEIDNGRYDVPDAGMITKTIELEINRP